MSTAAYLKIPGVKGECQVDGMEDTIELSSWSWSMSQPSSMQTGGGGGKSKVIVGDFMATKELDCSSPNLMQKCCKGDHYDKVEIWMTKQGGGDKPVIYLTVTLKEVMITAVDSSAGGEGDVLEQIGLAFAEFKYEYTQQDEKGGKMGASDAAWNVKTNKIP